MSDELQKMTQLARRLAIALIDEVAFHGVGYFSEDSIDVMTTAVRELGLQNDREDIEKGYARREEER